MEGVKDWLWNNPQMVGSTACSGLMLAAAAIMSKATKKERQSGEKREARSMNMVAKLNNNTVELAETAKSALESCKNSLEVSADKMILSNKGIAKTVIAELKANRRESRANSFLIAKLLEKARLPVVEKEEILSEYKSLLREEADVDEDID